MRTLIGVCGYSGAGKSSFCAEASRRHGIPVIATGEAVRREVVRRGRPLTPEDIAQVSDSIRQETGHRFMRFCEREIGEQFERTSVVLLDCLRERADLQILRGLTDRLILVAIVTGAQSRLDRMLGRDRAGDARELQGQRELQARERRLGVAALIARADRTLHNEGNHAEFMNATAAMMDALLGSG